jgi:hydrogenase maturation factor
MADAANCRLAVNPAGALLEEGKQLCNVTGLDPLGLIASGALLMAVHPKDAEMIQVALADDRIAAFNIGRVEEGSAAVVDATTDDLLPRPARDEIARLYE